MGAIVTRRRRSERGAELVEYALIVPVLMLILLGICEFGLALQAYIVVSNAAREGARVGMLVCASDPACYTTDDVSARVVAFVEAGLPSGAATPVTTCSCESSVRGISVERVAVSYTYQFQFISGIASLFGGSFTTIPMTAVSTMRKEKQGCPG